MHTSREACRTSLIIRNQSLECIWTVWTTPVLLSPHTTLQKTVAPTLDSRLTLHSVRLVQLHVAMVWWEVWQFDVT